MCYHVSDDMGYLDNHRLLCCCRAREWTPVRTFSYWVAAVSRWPDSPSTTPAQAGTEHVSKRMAGQRRVLCVLERGVALLSRLS